MPAHRTYKKIYEEKENTIQIKELVEVYQEVAAKRMQEIKELVVDAREYYETLANLSNDVGADIAEAFGEKGKYAAVFLSANSGLFGDIIDKVFVYFIDYVKKRKIDVYVLGTVGEELLKSYAPKIKYKYLELHDDQEIKEEALSQVINLLLSYEKITLFYGKFKNLATQYSFVNTFSGDFINQLEKSKETKEKIHLSYLYEPSINEVSEKFGKQVMASVFEESIKENQLAKFASRIMHLDYALGNIDERINELTYFGKRAIKRENGRKQVERVARLTHRRKGLDL